MPLPKRSPLGSGPDGTAAGEDGPFRQVASAHRQGAVHPMRASLLRSEPGSLAALEALASSIIYQWARRQRPGGLMAADGIIRGWCCQVIPAAAIRASI